MLARSRSTLLLAISETRLPSAHAPPDSIVDQKLAGHFALHHSWLSWLLRSHPKLPISAWFNGAASNPSDASNGSSETRSLDSRALPSNLADSSSIDAADTGDGYRSRGDPLPTSEGSRTLGGRLSSLRAPIAHAVLLFIFAGSKKKKKKNTPARVDSYIYSYDRVRAIGAGRAAHNDRSCERSWGRAPNRDVYACIRACTMRGRALMGPTADAAGIVRGAVSPRFKYWLTQVGFKRSWEREEGLHRSGPYQVIVCKPRAAAQSRSLFSGGCVWGRRKAPLLDDVDVPRAWHPSAKVTYYTARNTPRLRWGPTTDSRSGLVFLEISSSFFWYNHANFSQPISHLFFFFSHRYDFRMCDRSYLSRTIGNVRSHMLWLFICENRQDASSQFYFLLKIDVTREK